VTNPLQLINAPIVLDSRQLHPASLDAIVHPPNFPEKERTIMAMVKAHVIPIGKVSTSNAK
jgi:hypothetical protein